MKTEKEKLRDEIKAIDKMLKAMVVSDRSQIKLVRCSVVSEGEAIDAEKYKEPRPVLYYHQVEISPKLMWITLNQQKKHLQMKLKG